jgi:hypothetical protein
MATLGFADRALEIIKSDTRLQDDFKQDPVKTMEKVTKQINEEAQAAYLSDKQFYRIVVYFLGGDASLAAIGSIILVSISKTTPEVLVALGSAAIGALVGLFAPSPVNKKR